MKANELSLDPELSAALGECVPGTTKDITLRVTVDSMDGGFKGTVQSVIDYEDGEEGDEAVPAPTKPAPKGPQRARALAEAVGEEY